MSTSSINTSSGSTTIQNLARSIMDQFDANKDGQFCFDEFATFLDGLVQTVTDQQKTAATSTTKTSSSAASVSSLFMASASPAAATAGSSTAYRNRMLGFDFNRFESAKGSLKYDAANIMQGIDPSSPGAMQKAYEEMVKLHPGDVSLDQDGNLMLDGTADGYIGIRPLDRSEDWANAPSGYVWQWMAYNPAHPGPNGEK